MAIIGAVFTVVVVLVLLYFGMSVVSPMMDDADSNIDSGTALEDSYETSVEMTAPAFSIMGAGVWILVLVFVISGLYLLLKVL